MNRLASPLSPPDSVPFEFGDRKILKEGRFLSLCADEAVAADGRKISYEMGVRKGEPEIVTVLPITKDNEALLIWQYRIPMRAYVLENVAGLVDPGQNPVSTVVKEILEETGYRVAPESVVRLGMVTPASSGGTTEKIECFVARDAEYAGPQDLEAAEAIEVVKLPLETAFETVLATSLSGRLVDAKVLALLATVRA